MRSDLELLDAWRGGEVAAGDELVSRHWASISRFFRAKVGDDGADLISQTFLACVEGKDKIAGDNIKAYLFGVARRRLADHLRKRMRGPAVDFAVSSLVDCKTGPATAALRQQRSELLRDGLARIPLDDQIALELAYFEAMSTAEIASVLEIPENTVRSRLSRAREKLRLALEQIADRADADWAESQLVTPG